MNVGLLEEREREGEWVVQEGSDGRREGGGGRSVL